MGSFSFTCSYSGLPIEAGNKLRFMLITKTPYQDKERAITMSDLWIPRTFPLTGVYDDYGSVKDYEKGPAQKIWLEGLQLDMHEKGWGDNTCHDVPTLKDMNFEDMLTAISEGRLEVNRSEKSDDVKVFGKDSLTLLRERAGLTEEELTSTWEPDKGIPTLQRIMKLFEKKKIAISQVKDVEGFYIIDEESHGTVRIRWNTYGEMAEHMKNLTAVLDILNEDYAAMITCGTGNYSNPAEILVRPKPGKTKQGHYVSLALGALGLKDKPLPIEIVMIREDVWQALVDVSKNHRKGEIGWMTRGEGKKEPDWDAAARACWDADIEFYKKPDRDRMFERIMSDMDRGFGMDYRGKWSAGNHGIYHVGLGSHWKLMVKKTIEGKVTPEQVDNFLKVAVEFARVQEVMSVTRYYWRPSNSCGPQYGCWDSSSIVMKKLAEIAENIRDKKARDAEQDEADFLAWEKAEAAKKAKNRAKKKPKKKKKR